MDHSIVIPTRNHPERLEACLASILDGSAGSPGLEVLVLDNSDQDMRAANRDVVRAQADPRARHVEMAGVGLMAARHAGIAAASAPVVSFIDDDELLLPGWFDGVRACLRDPRVAVVTGPFVPLHEVKPPRWLSHLYDEDANGRHLLALTLFDGGDRERDVDPIWALGGNITIRKLAFEQLRGSHPDLMPSELAAFQGDGESGLMVKVRAAGMRTRYSPACGVLHAVSAERVSIEYLVQRAWHGGLEASFTATRRLHGLKEQEGVPNAPPRAVASLGLRRAGRAVERVGSTLAGRYRSPAAREVRRRMREAHRAGYEWHQARLLETPGLQEYVCRRDYLGDNAALP